MHGTIVEGFGLSIVGRSLVPRDMHMIAHYGHRVNIQVAQNMAIVFDYGPSCYKEVKLHGQL